jgi:electron transport complex protein RnfD
MSGSLGETSVLLIVAGGVFPLATRVICWHIPVGMIGTLMLLAGGFHLLDSSHYPGVMHHLLAGATLLGAFFIATGLVTSPVTSLGQLLFGAGCGALVYVIRTWAGYPEGMAFAIMLMNAFTPLIDHYLKPRVYGRDRKGNPMIKAAIQD